MSQNTRSAEAGGVEDIAPATDVETAGHEGVPEPKGTLFVLMLFLLLLVGLWGTVFWMLLNR